MEISEVNFKELFINHEIVRFDSEPFTFKFKEKNTNFSMQKLEELVDFNPSKLEIYKNTLNASFLPMQAINRGYHEDPEEILVKHYSNGYTYFKENDLLFATITPCMEHGKCTIANNLTNGIGFGSTELIVMREKENTNVLKEYLFSYLNRDIIRDKAKSYFIGTSGRQRVPSYFYKNLNIPLVSMEFQILIKKLHDDSSNLRNHSKQAYSKAQDLLLEELDLKDFKPSSQSINIKNLSESFTCSGRLDAEYYQPKYEEIVAKIKDKQHKKLSDIVEIKKSIEPGSDNYAQEGLPFLRVADLDKFGISAPQKYLSDNFIVENQEKINKLKPKKGTILFTKDGSIGIAYHVREDFEGITSGAILHLSLKDKKINPQYLTLVLNSFLVQQQAKRDMGGSIILHWRVSEIENVIIPILSQETQSQIAELIEKSFALKSQSENLLSSAKKAVEIAIEDSEQKAMEFIKRD